MMAEIERPASPEARYAALGTAFFERGDVTPSEMKGFGSRALVVNERIFALLSGGRLVVKLPRARVAALIGAGWGEHWDANRGRPMREWLKVDAAHEDDWLSLAQEALVFVKGRRQDGG